MKRGIEGLAVATVTELNSIDIFTGTQADSDELCAQDIVNRIHVVEGRSTGPALKGGVSEAAVVRLKRNEQDIEIKSKRETYHGVRIILGRGNVSRRHIDSVYLTI